jgi:hypothetical protein
VLLFAVTVVTWALITVVSNLMRGEPDDGGG